MTTTETTEATTEAQPPQDYGNGDTWADDGPWYVPEVLRAYYAAAEPSEAMRRGYLMNGVDVVEDQSADVIRGIESLDPARDPVVTTETIVRRTLVHKSGAEYYRTWLHDERVTIAYRHHKDAERQAAIEARWFTCQLCGTKSYSVAQRTAPETPHVHLSRRIAVVTCPDCYPVLDRAALAHFTGTDAARVLPDGRPAAEAAADLIARLTGD